MSPLLPLDEPEDWSAEIYDAAIEFFDGEVQVRRPSTGGTYDPVTDSYAGGAPGAVIIDWRPGRAQQLTSPSDVHDSTGWASKRRYLFQCENRPADPIIPKGSIVRFRGGKDHTLAQIAFQVSASSMSSSAALRTIRATTEGEPSA